VRDIVISTLQQISYGENISGEEMEVAAGAKSKPKVGVGSSLSIVMVWYIM
jgi:hypothetical protein